MATKELNDKQLRAIELLVEGESVNDVATAIGVSRQTVSTWKNKDELFKAELDKCRQSLKSEVDGRLLTHVVPLTDKLIKIALKSSSDKTSLDAIIYAINRLCGTPTNKIQDVSNDKDNNVELDIDQLVSEIKSDNNVIDISQAK
ncbi:phBC6A51 family helix-turn-helix protein [Clostridium beijerinckii]|uniref:phBC6A51 family helix-turn-helix protein n=2 Tax=Clostridium beijerinckii TaxID=1520 RepID=UPI000A1C7731|nr:phBC6A51 family helix-turn-helix protein [Clostridium beijerinckii]MBA8935542.1 AcrR family transcriptional regulator [Clostridium beijerinckii]NRU39937.1 AcrR family transcriptional regulator [Clostridium beijerinckii]NSA96784.1 AcrR family transcriptional regulator [Clostridium beijerinckii]CUU47325.1 DNA-binding protein [Clostridium beijerinckii]